MRRTIALGGFAALLAMIAGSASVSASSAPIPKFDHVFVIMMENTGFNSLIGNPNAPFINEAAGEFGLATSYFGVTHPSQPNYIAITSGSTNGVLNDNDITIDVPNIVDQVEASGRTWKSYSQSLSLCATKFAHACGGPAGFSPQLYERKHNPFVSYKDVATNSARMLNVVDFSQLNTDLASGNVPNYSFIDPDQCHDMHGTSFPGSCNFGQVQSLISTGDAFLANTVGAITSSETWQDSNSAIFVMWDESDFTGSPNNFGFGDTSGCCDANPGGGHVVALVISRSNNSTRAVDQPYNHYSTLSTIEHAWGLGCLGFTCDVARVHPMIGLTAGV